MRGKGCRPASGYPGSRITPAYAGKSRKHIIGRTFHRDHPRVCGEKPGSTSMVRPMTGSPPRMRGKANLYYQTHGGFRITPAYAGKRTGTASTSRCSGDHPRVCGEKKDYKALCKDLLGSPPRMRGKVASWQILIPLGGITPAYAGKRLKRSRSTVPPVAIVPLFPSVCNKPVVSDGSPAGRDAPLFLPAENAVPASPAYNLRSL